MENTVFNCIIGRYTVFNTDQIYKNQIKISIYPNLVEYHIIVHTVLSNYNYGFSLRVLKRLNIKVVKDESIGKYQILY